MGCGSSIPVAETNISSPDSPTKSSDNVIISSPSSSSITSTASTQQPPSHVSHSSTTPTASNTGNTTATSSSHHHVSSNITNSSSSSSTASHTHSSGVTITTGPTSSINQTTQPQSQSHAQTSVWALSSTLAALSNIDDISLRTSAIQQLNEVWLTPDGNNLRKEFIVKEGADRIWAVIISTLQKGPLHQTEGPVIVKLLSLLYQHSSVNHHSSPALLYFNDALLLEKTSLQTWVNLLISFSSSSLSAAGNVKDSTTTTPNNNTANHHSLVNPITNALHRIVPVEAIYSIADILIHCLTLTTVHTISLSSNNSSSTSSSSSSSSFLGPSSITTTDISVAKRKQIKEYITQNNEIWNWIINILRGLHSPNMKVLATQLATALVESDRSITNTSNNNNNNNNGITGNSTVLSTHSTLNNTGSAAISSSSGGTTGTAMDDSPTANDDSGYEQCVNGMINLKGFEACTLLLSSCIGAGITSQNAAVAYARKVSANQNLESVVDSILGTSGSSNAADPSIDREASTVILLSPAPAIIHLLHTCARLNKKDIFESMVEASILPPLHDLITACIYPNLLRGSSVDLVLATVRLIQYFQQYKTFRGQLLSAGAPRICSQLLCTKAENDTLKNRLTILHTSASQLLEQLFTYVMKNTQSNSNQDSENILTTYGYLLRPAQAHQPAPPTFPPEAFELLPALSLIPDTSVFTDMHPYRTMLDQIQDPFVYVTIVARTLDYSNGISVILSVGNLVEDRLTSIFVSNDKRYVAIRRRTAPLLWTIAVERARYTSKGWKEIRHIWHHIHRKQMEKLHSTDPSSESRNENEEDDNVTEDTDSEDDSIDTDPDDTSDDNESVADIEGSHTSDTNPKVDASVKNESSVQPDEHFDKFYTKGGIPYYVNERKTKAMWSKPRAVTATEVTTNTVTKIYSDSFIEPPKEDNKVGLRIFWALHDAGYYRIMPNAVNTNETESLCGWWAEDDPVIRMCLCSIACEALCEAPFLHPTGAASSTSELPMDHDSSAPIVRKENITISSEFHKKNNEEDPFHINRHHHHWPYLHHKDNEKSIQDILVYIRACVESLEAARRGQNILPVLLRKSPNKTVYVNPNDKNRNNNGSDNLSRSNFARTVSFSMDTPTRKGSTGGNGTTNNYSTSNGAVSGNQSPRYRRSFLDGNNGTPGGSNNTVSSAPGTPNPESIDWLNSQSGNTLQQEWPFANSGVKMGSLPYILPFAFTSDFIASIARISRCQKYPETTTFAAFVIRDIYSAFILQTLDSLTMANGNPTDIAMFEATSSSSKSNSRRATYSTGNETSTDNVALPGSNNPSSMDYDENTFFGGLHLYAINGTSHRHPTMSPILAAVAGLPNMNNTLTGNNNQRMNNIPNNAFVPRPNPINPPNNIHAPPGLEANNGVVIFHSPFQRQRTGSANPTQSKVNRWNTTTDMYNNPNTVNLPRCLINTVTVEDIDNMYRLPRSRSGTNGGANTETMSSSNTGILGSAMSHIRSLLSSSTSSSSSSTVSHSTVPVSSQPILPATLFTLPIVHLRTGSLWQYPWIIDQHNVFMQISSSPSSTDTTDDLKSMLIQCGALIGIKSAFFQLTMNTRIDRASPSGNDENKDGSLSPIQQAKARLRKTNAYSNRYGAGNSTVSNNNGTERSRSDSISEKSSITNGISSPQRSLDGMGSPDRSIPTSPSLFSTPVKGMNESFSLSSPTALPVSNTNVSTTNTNNKPTFAFSPRGYNISSPGILKNRKVTTESSKEWELGLRLINEALNLLQGQPVTTNDTINNSTESTAESTTKLMLETTVGTVTKIETNTSDSLTSLSKVVDALADHAAADDAFRRMKERSANARLERMRNKYLAAAAGNVSPMTSPSNHEVSATVSPPGGVISPSSGTNRARGIAHLRSFVLGTASPSLTVSKSDTDINNQSTKETITGTSTGTEQ